MGNCIRNYQKSTINAYNTATQGLATGTNIQFSQFEETGCSIVPSGAIGVKINKSGLYLVTFSGTAVESGTAGLVTVNLYRNGSTVNGASASATSTAGDTPTTVNVNFATIIDVKCSCGCVDNTVILTVQNDGIGATYSNAELNVVKLC